MRQLTVISGKGGTGKTTITAAFASLAKNAVVADCDVDAPDLHLLLSPDVQETIDFHGLKVARKREDRCTSCGVCRAHCTFNASGEDLDIIADRCEGCGVCEFVCPEEAIDLVDRLSGHAYRSVMRFGPMAHARLDTGEESSGKLVTLVRNLARRTAMDVGADIVIIDGPPGFGCPVIASIAGVDLVLVVTEPTLSGSHDLERILGVAEHFGVPAVVCINRYDINQDISDRIATHCMERGLEVVGRLPYDNDAIRAMISRMTVTEYSEGTLSNEVRTMWERVRRMLG